MTGDDALDVLHGGHLDTVSFVMDYVEFRISYSVLRALTPPVVRLADRRAIPFPGPGSRDALCELIDTTVESAHVVGADQSDERRIEVRTDEGHLLTISLTGDSGGSERAHLVPADERGELQIADMVIW